MSNRTRTSVSRIRLPREERRQQLLDVTKRIVGEDGLHVVSIDRVAREAGITRPIVYGHFTDLPGLLRALLEREGVRALRQITALMPPPASGDDDVIEVLMAALTGFLEAVRAEPVTWRLVLMPPEGAPASVRDGIQQARAAITSQLAELIEQSYEPYGGQRSPDPLLTASSMTAIADHWARLLLTEPETFDLERILVHGRWAIERFAPR